MSAHFDLEHAGGLSPEAGRVARLHRTGKSRIQCKPTKKSRNITVSQKLVCLNRLVDVFFIEECLVQKLKLN